MRFLLNKIHADGEPPEDNTDIGAQVWRVLKEHPDISPDRMLSEIGMLFVEGFETTGESLSGVGGAGVGGWVSSRPAVGGKQPFTALGRTACSFASACSACSASVLTTTDPPTPNPNPNPRPHHQLDPLQHRDPPRGAGQDRGGARLPRPAAQARLHPA